MKPWGSRIALALVLLTLIVGVAELYRMRVRTGDVFPKYSSLRADPLGTRALYESLAALPGLRVTRALQPLAKLTPAPGDTLVLAGLSARRWAGLPVEQRNALDAAVRGGTRLVVLLAPENTLEAGRVELTAWDPPEEDEGDDAPAGEKPADQKKGGKKPPPKKPEKTPAPRPAGRPEGTPVPEAILTTASWERLWGVELWARKPLDKPQDAVRQTVAPAGLPAAVVWHSQCGFKFSAGTPWRVLYAREELPVLAELNHGRGSLVLAGDVSFVTNEALQKHRAPALLAWLVGDATQVVFVESHLGVVEDPGVAALARRYGLAPAMALLGLLAALYVWRQAAGFVPPAPEAEAVALDFHPTAGLEALLRRAVSPAQLFATCVAEWRRSARPAEVARIAALDPRQPPATAYNTAVRLLRRH